MPVIDAEHDEFVLSGGGRVYDFCSTSFQTSFGHSNQPIRQAIHDQLDRMPIASPKSVFQLKQIVTDELLELINIRNNQQIDGRIFYTVSGAESVENALKIARHYTGRKIILSRKRSYHGATLGAMSVSGDWRSQGHLNFEEGTLRIPEPNDDPHALQTREIIQNAGPENVAAIIVETISGVNGVYIPCQSWWEAIETLCDEYGILLICDEVLVGFGRTGPNLAFHQFGVQPDMICMAKGITGGYIPFGAVWTSSKIAHRYDENVLACGLTSYAHPLGLAATGAVISLLKDASFQQNKSALQATFDARLTQFNAQANVAEVRHRGLLAAIEFRGAIPTWQHFLDSGLYLVVRDNMVVIAPPMVSKPERLEHAFDTLTNVMKMNATTAI